MLACDLSDDTFAALVGLADVSPKVSRPAWRTIRDAMAHALDKKPAELGDDLEAWKENVPDLRAVFGTVAKKKGWYKTEELGGGARQAGGLGLEPPGRYGNAPDSGKLRGFAEHG